MTALRRDRTILLLSALLCVLTMLAAARQCRAPRPVSPDGAAGLVDAAGQGGESAGAAPVGPPDALTTYTVSPGDTLSTIAARFGTTVDALASANDLSDADAVFVGQVLRLRVVPDRDGPATVTVPDSELVYGPAYAGFDAAAFVATQPGRLAAYSELVDGEALGGAQIVERVAREFSVGPRVLLAFIEARGGWVTGVPVADNASAADYPAGLADPARSGLWRQLSWLADRLNGGYYDWKTRDNRLLPLTDGTHLGGHPSLGPGSFALQRALALQSDERQLVERLAAFDEAYRRLFGDPWARAVATPRRGEVAFPALQLPFARGETWWLTGGPHGGWADGSAWAAIDFVPDDVERGCYVSPAWTTAVADGVVLDGGAGQLWLDLDGDGRRETGPAVFYLHLAADGRVAAGTRVKVGDRLGRPSCEGGMSSATHVHVARTFDGEWIAAAGADPLRLGEWEVTGAPEAYDGGMRRGAREMREACECRVAGYNDVAW